MSAAVKDSRSLMCVWICSREAGLAARSSNWPSQYSLPAWLRRRDSITGRRARFSSSSLTGLSRRSAMMASTAVKKAPNLSGAVSAVIEMEP